MTFVDVFVLVFRFVLFLSLSLSQCRLINFESADDLRMAAKRLESELKIDMKFNDNFKPNQPRRRKSICAIQSTFNSDGRIRATKKNVCDCLIKNCVGCHFPCKSCKSTKCGPDCRRNRYDYTQRIHTEGTTSNDDVHNPHF